MSERYLRFLQFINKKYHITLKEIHSAEYRIKGKIQLNKKQYVDIFNTIITKLEYKISLGAQLVTQKLFITALYIEYYSCQRENSVFPIENLFNQLGSIEELDILIERQELPIYLRQEAESIKNRVLEDIRAIKKEIDISEYYGYCITCGERYKMVIKQIEEDLLLFAQKELIESKLEIPIVKNLNKL